VTADDPVSRWLDGVSLDQLAANLDPVPQGVEWLLWAAVLVLLAGLAYVTLRAKR
jgi:hypothetical protein